MSSCTLNSAGDKDSGCVNSLVNPIMNYRLQGAEKGGAVGEDHTRVLAARRPQSGH